MKVARSAFYRVYLDIGDGNGPTYAGLYTMVEDLSNKFLDSQFKDDSGNLYKPDGQAATWSTFSEEDFIKRPMRKSRTGQIFKQPLMPFTQRPTTKSAGEIASKHTSMSEPI